MKLLRRIKVDDNLVIETLSKNKRIKDHGLISKEILGIKSKYREYCETRAEIGAITPLGCCADLKDALHRLYKNEVAGLEFISTIRDKLSIQGCPMCGRPTNGGEVDHILEKGTYSEYSLYSYNLVPSCKCNNNRTPCVVAGVAIRPLHPYFDKAMARRLARASFCGSFAAPTVSIEPVGGLGYMKPRVLGHIESVLLPVEIESWLSKRWENLLVNPVVTLTIDAPIVVPEQLVNRIRQLRDGTDFEQSLNCWDSMWYSGLLANSKVIAGLCKMMAGVDKNLIPDVG